MSRLWWLGVIGGILSVCLFSFLFFYFSFNLAVNKETDKGYREGS